MLSYGAIAQGVGSPLVPDSSLGANSSTVMPDVFVNGAPATQIEGGAQRGENLFHSFEQFNIGAGQRVYFANPDAVSTILTRVTGDSASNIFGTLGVAGTADLFLINPNGIVFGPNAALDVSGSTIFSTADAVLLGNDVTFGVNSGAVSSLLTVSTPLGLQYGRNPGELVVEGGGNRLSESTTGGLIRTDRPVGLQVPANETLALVGGDLFLDGGNVTAEGGRLELGSVAAGGEVALTPVNSGWAFDYGAVQNFQNIFLSQAASADASGGDLQVVGRDIGLFDGSVIVANTLGTETDQLFRVQASDSVSLDATSNTIASGLYAQSAPTATGNANDVVIDTPLLFVSDGAQVNADIFGPGVGRNLVVNARNIGLLGAVFGGDRPGGLFAANQSDAPNIGRSGNITLNASNEVLVLNGAQVSTQTSGLGVAGNIDVNAPLIVLSDITNGVPSGLFTTSRQANLFDAGGDAGDLSINTNQLFVQFGAQASTSSFGSGASGDLDITAQRVNLVGNFATDRTQTGLFTSSFSNLMDSTFPNNPGGDAGDLNIQTDQLLVRDGARVETSTYGAGESGNLSITARDVELVGIPNDGVSRTTTTGLSAASQSFFTAGAGNAGTLTLNTRQLRVREGAEVSSGTARSDAGGGDLKIQAQSLEVLSGGRISTTTGGSGRSGNLDITAQQVLLSGALDNPDSFFPASRLTTASNSPRGAGGGNAGDLTLNAEQVLVEDGARISTATFSGSNGGNLNIVARSQLSVNGGTISVAAPVDGDPGTLQITSPFIRLDNGEITARTRFGNGGNISLRADDVLLLRNGSVITTATGSNKIEGDGGNITIDAGSVVALLSENSDIIANSFEGVGGNVSLNVQGLLGIEVREVLTPLSDITASSEIGVAGNVDVNLPSVGPNAEALELPTGLVDTSAQIGQSLCSGEGNEFAATGRGGLPSSPYETLSSAVTWEDWYIEESSSLEVTDLRETDLEETDSVSATSDTTTLEQSSGSPPVTTTLVEAQGWGRNAQGALVLTEQADARTGDVVVADGLSCQKLRESLG